MCAKKKAGSNKTWKLAGEPIYSTPLTSAEREEIEEEFWVYKRLRGRDSGGMPTVTPAEARTHESAVQAVAGALCQHYAERFQWSTVIKVIAATAAIQANLPKRTADRLDFLMGAALWLLDHLEDACDDPDEYLDLLPEESSGELEYYMPCAEDLIHDQDTILRMVTVLEGREKSYRKEFRALLDLIDPDTAAKLRTAFKASLLDYLDRAIEIYNRLKPAGSSDLPDLMEELTRPSDPLRQANRRSELPEIYFLLLAPDLICHPQSRMQEELHSRKATELLAGYGTSVPYELCAAYLLLEREGDALASLNALTAVVMICALRHLPWAQDDFGARAGLFEEGAPDYRLQYEYCEESVEDGEEPLELEWRLSETQLFFLATGVVLPRNRMPSDKLRRWFIRQGVEEQRARELAWAAFMAYFSESEGDDWKDIDLFGNDKVDKAVDFRKLYEIVEPLYSEEDGRPSVDPVVLFKIVLLQHLDGIASLRGTLRRAQTDIAYRWFLGYTLNEELPHFSTVSYNFRHRFTEETIERVFQWVLNEAGTAGALSPAAVFIDGTHIKASANLNKKIKQEVSAAAKRYRDELLAEINADREAHGKKPFDDDDEPPAPAKKKRDNTSKKKLARRKKAGFKAVTKSTTDPDCDMFVKGKHQRQFAYKAHTACDKNGYVLETVVTPGNVHDSVAFDDVYDKVTQTFPEIETIVADSAYKTPHICKKVFDDGRVLSTAYKRPMTIKGGHEWWKYVYDEYYDCVICPEYQPLAYRTTNRDGYREYCSDPKICTQCPTRQLCTHSKNCVKTVLRHVWKDYEELADDARYTPEYKNLYAKRKETIERVFADAKEKHGMRYTLYRGLTQVSKWMRLKFAAMNLKKLARWKALRTSSSLFAILKFQFRCQKPDTFFEYPASSTG